MTKKLFLNQKLISLILLLSLFQIYTTNCGTQTFTSLNVPITIPSSGPANPYPSTLNVPITDDFCKVTATITGLTHTFPDDIRILLVSPTGQRVILMANAGSGFPVNNVNLTFDDAASSFLPDSSQIISGTYKPSSYGNGLSSALPLPAPTIPPNYDITMSTFNGNNPNGVWNLFVFDDLAGDSGSIASWSLTFFIGDLTATNTTVNSCGTTIIDLNPLVCSKSGISSFQILSGPTNGTLVNNGLGLYTYSPNTAGPDSFTYQVNATDGSTAQGTVNITVTGTSPLLIAPLNIITCKNKQSSAFDLTALISGGTPPYSQTITALPQHGFLSGTFNNAFYIPNANYVGPDSFTYRVTDSKGCIATRIINITVTNMMAQTGNFKICDDSSIKINLADLIIDGTPPYVFTITNNVVNGTLTGSNGNLTYTPKPGFIGNDQFSFSVTDAAGCQSSNIVNLTIISCSDIVRAIKAKYC